MPKQFFKSHFLNFHFVFIGLFKNFKGTENVILNEVLEVYLPFRLVILVFCVIKNIKKSFFLSAWHDLEIHRHRVKRPRVKCHIYRVKQHSVKRHRVKKCDKRAKFHFDYFWLIWTIFMFIWTISSSARPPT